MHLHTKIQQLKTAARINPLTYGVDALKNVIFPYERGAMGPDFPVYLDVGVILGLSVLFILLGNVAFGRRV